MGPPLIGDPRCRRACRHLQAFVDGEADRADAWQVARHLSGCARCFLDADTFRVVSAAIGRLRVAPDPAVMLRLRRVVERDGDLDG